MKHHVTTLSIAILLLFNAGCTIRALQPTQQANDEPSAIMTDGSNPLQTVVTTRPADLGTPMPSDGERITSQNAKQVSELVRWGRGIVGQVIYAPDGKAFSIVTLQGVYTYDATTYQEVKSISVEGCANPVAISPDVKLLACVNVGNKIGLYRIEDGKQIRILDGHSQQIHHLIFMPDGGALISIAPDSIRLWRVSDGSMIASHSSFWGYSIALSPDGKVLAIGYEKLVWLLNSQDMSVIGRLEGPGNYILSLAFTPDGDRLASAALDGTVRLWQVSNGALLQDLESDKPITALTFDHDGHILAGSSPLGSIRLWRPDDGALIQEWNAELDAADITFTPDGQFLLWVTMDGTLQQWHVGNPEPITHILDGYLGVIDSLAFTNDGTLLASGSASGVLCLRRVKGGELARSIRVEQQLPITRLSYSGDGQYLAVGLYDGEIQIWRTSEMTLTQTLSGHDSAIQNLVFSGDGNALVSASEDGSNVWALHEGAFELQSAFDGPGIAFAPGDGVVVTGDTDGTLQIKQLEDGKSLKIIDQGVEGLNAVFVSMNGKTLASVSSSSAENWHAPDGVRLFYVDGWKYITTLSSTDKVTTLDFTPDALMLATVATDEENVSLWRVSDGYPLARLPGHTARINSVSFSPGGRLLATGSADGTIRIWGPVQSRSE